MLSTMFHGISMLFTKVFERLKIYLKQNNLIQPTQDNTANKTYNRYLKYGFSEQGNHPITPF